MRRRGDASTDDDLTDLVRKRCTRAGMIMEDASLLAVTLALRRGDDTATDTAAALGRLKEDALRISALLAAAGALLSLLVEA